MDIEKGKWVDGKYVDANGNEIKGIYFHYIKKVFTVPVLTMLGIWILVYYQVTSHYHKYSYGGGWETKKISQH